MENKSIKKRPAPALLSFHDITINNFIQVDKHLEMLSKEGFPFCALLVVPYIPDDVTQEVIVQFSEWIQQQHFKGREIFLHGYTHKANPELSRSLLGRLKNSINNNEAEFAGLNKTDTQTLFHQSLSAFKDLFNNTPTGFVAPTWLDSPSLQSEVFTANIPIYESRFTLSLSKGKSRITLPISWFQNSILFSMGNLLFTLFTATPIPIPIKLAVHPIDTESEEKLNSVISMCKKVAQNHQFITYQSLFDQDLM